MRLKAREWAALALMLAGIALTASLARWQWHRAVEKAGLEARMQAREALPPLPLGRGDLPLADVEYRRVAVRGTWLPASAVYLDNRPLNGRVGYQVVMPLMLSSQRAVLVDRGWVEKRPGTEGQVPAVPTPTGPVDVVGQAVPSLPHFLELGKGGEERLGGVWRNLPLERYRAASGLGIEPFVLLQTSPSADGLQRERPRPGSDVPKHRGYAFQWSALCLLLTGLTLYFGVRRAFVRPA